MQIPAEHLKRCARALGELDLAEMSHVLAPWAQLPRDFGGAKRTRLFSPSRTFWLFLSQVLGGDGSCRDALRQFQAWLFLEEGKTTSPSTAAYCKARAKLSHREIQQASIRVAGKMETACPWSWHGRRVMVADGTGLSMPDTPENQAAWPQPNSVKAGCGFPVMRAVALFSLATGAIAGMAYGALGVHERTLSRTLWPLLKKGDVLLADRGFCALADFHVLLKRGVDCVMRKNGRRKNARVIKKINKYDRIVEWERSRIRPKWLSPRTWLQMPESITVREVLVSVQIPGFRSHGIFVATTLLDHRAYPASAISGLYLKRWKAELFFRDIKTTMGMEILRCQTPRMVENELWMHVTAYNLVRAVMLEAALAHGAPPGRISFKGTVSILRHWATLFTVPQPNGMRCLEIYSAMLAYIARDTLPSRPGRTEPRARKRRPKNYQLLSKHRNLFTETPHRSRYAKP